MFVIDRQANRIAKLDHRTFKDLGFEERPHLQEWLAHYPDALGEELLIIQKEFQGFMETRERLDLLALDKSGNLVLIENKLDSSGKDVTWQALKYASYCSSLSREEIRGMYQQYLDRFEPGAKAGDRIVEFLDKPDWDSITLNEGTKQRIILVAAKFRQEVTSTVLWLMSNGINIKCFRVTPYQVADQLLLNVEQVLPIQDSEDFMVRMASKAQDERAAEEGERAKKPVRMEFWSAFLQASQGKSELFLNTTPTKDNWIGVGLGLSGVGMNLVVANRYARTEIYINRGEQDENKDCFDFLKARQDAIEAAFGKPLTWERMDSKITARIKNEMEEVDVYNRDDWQKMFEFLLDSSKRMHTVFKPHVKELGAFLRQRD
jgi:hypothetical protein